METHKHKKIKYKMPKLKVWYLAAAVIVLFGLLLFTNPQAFGGSSEGGAKLPVLYQLSKFVSQPFGGGSSEAVKIDFYVMSQCPFGTQVVDAFAPLAEKFGDSIDFNIHYIADEAADGTFSSLHGQKEVNGNIIQLCAAKYNPKTYLEMIVCQDKNTGAIPDNWEACAKEAGLKVEDIRSCYEGDEGKQLLSASIKKSQEVGATGSPTIYFNNTPYASGRDTFSFQRTICAYLPDHQECSDIPPCASDADCPAKEGKIASCENAGETNAKCVYNEPVSFEQLVISDDDCVECDPSNAAAATEGYFTGAATRYLDIDDDETKALIEKYNIEKIPTILFTREIYETATYKERADFYDQFFEDLGDHVKLSDQASGAIKFVSAEKQEAFEAAERAKNAEAYELIGLDESDNKPQIDFWLMSYCPFGNQAEEIVYEVYKNLGDTAYFHPRYVFYENYQGGGPNFCIDEENLYCSMHGVQEANQGVRELCVLRDYGIGMWFDFAIAMNSACNAGNADTCWQAVAEGLELDTAAVSTCQESDYLELITPSVVAGKVLGATGSPAIYIEGISYSGERDANSIQTALCNAFDTPPEACGTALEGGDTTAPTGSC